MVRRGVGSNQYKTQVGVADPPAAGDLVAQVWGLNRIQRLRVAENPNTPPDILTQLAGDKDVYVRWGVAANPNTPPDTLVQLAGDKNTDVRWGVAENPNTPADTLVQLTGDKRERVSSAAWENTNLPEEYRALAQLAQ